MTRPTEDLLRIAAQHNSPNYSPTPIVFKSGEGVWLTDRDGNKYLDFVAGVAVCSLGYTHPRLTKALHEQIDRLLHVSNLYYSEEQIELIERLTNLSFADRVFFCNSGAEANEAAFKLARRYQSRVVRDESKTKIISMHSSFHGRTYAAVTATGQPKYHDGLEPLSPGFDYITFNDLDEAKEAIDSQTAAVIIEPIQGESGVRPATKEFLQGLRKLCDETGALLIFDEVQAGIGRVGTLFAYEHFGVTPDIMTLAKGIGGGVPLGATLATEEIWKAWPPGSHGATFGGNPLAARAGCTVLDTIADENILENVRTRGEELQAGLRELARDFEIITEIRGVGLMVGAQIGPRAREIVDLARQEGLLINAAGGTTLRFVPPLIVSADEVTDALSRLRRALERLPPVPAE